MSQLPETFNPDLELAVVLETSDPVQLAMAKGLLVVDWEGAKIKK